MKKLFSIIFALLLIVSAASAAVTVRENFVDNNNQALTGVQVLKYKSLDAAVTNVDITSEVSLNSGTNSFVDLVFDTAQRTFPDAIYFFKQGFVPTEGAATWYGNGAAPAQTVKLTKIDMCTAPIQKLSLLNTIHNNQPLVINIDADLSGDVYSAIALANNAVEYIPTGYLDHYMVETVVEVDVYNDLGQLIWTDQETKEIMFGSKDSFTFTWTPDTAGTYRVEAYTTVPDDKCLATARTPSEEFPVVEVLSQPVHNECYTLIQELETFPVTPVAGSPITVKGTKTSNFAAHNSQTSPIEADLQLYVDNVLVETKTYPRNSDDGYTPFEFTWTPAAVGTHTIKVTSDSTSDTMCAGLPYTGQPEQLTVIVLAPGTNTAPVINRIPDQRAEIGQTPDFKIDLWQYTSDYETQDSQLTFTIQESNEAAIDCSLTDNRYITCSAANTVGTNEILVQASDSSLAGSQTFKVNVFAAPSEPVVEEVESREWLQVSRLLLGNGEFLAPGDDLELGVTLRNNGNIDYKDVKITAIIPDLGIRRSAGPFDLDDDDEESRNLVLELPEDMEKGEYLVRIVISEGGAVNRIKHRFIEII